MSFLCQFFLQFDGFLLEIFGLFGEKLGLLPQCGQDLFVVLFAGLFVFQLYFIFFDEFLHLFYFLGRICLDGSLYFVFEFLVGLLYFVEVQDDIAEEGFDLNKILLEGVLLIFGFLLSFLLLPFLLVLDEEFDVIAIAFDDLIDLVDILCDFAHGLAVLLNFLASVEGDLVVVFSGLVFVLVGSFAESFLELIKHQINNQNIS